ncbi:hypothetical protein KSF_058640 [Reticulibacter mediterranei]|uniref:BioF2-like acetyltransferase domain-containing protein n=1 Tax=Reticulibacter mediterranei TaxID=2778369 RepID=A0A8J3IJT9_9CHLR|nr:GNAT family N-acetyltransferase [Reticulibacter mediterranei]GHO95816.1 hypothetical protein KSF_058640 [Reticulibacter mediterranei]
MLISAAIEQTRAKDATGFQFKAMSTDFDGLVDGVIGVPLFETYQLALPEHPDLLRLDSKIRRAVKKASRSGMRVRDAETIGELKAWYDLYLQTMRRLVALPKPYRFFEQAWRRLHPEGVLRLLLAEQVQAGQSRLIAGILLLQWGQTVSYSFAGWRREDQNLRPNDLLHWHAIQSACEEGGRWYDFGNVRVGNQGLIQFKRKWGAETASIYRYSYPSVPGVSPATGNSFNPASSPNQSRGSRVRHWVTPLWQHLPIRTVRLIGDCCHTLRYY